MKRDRYDSQKKERLSNINMFSSIAIQGDDKDLIKSTLLIGATENARHENAGKEIVEKENSE